MDKNKHSRKYPGCYLLLLFWVAVPAAHAVDWLMLQGTNPPYKDHYFFGFMQAGYTHDDGDDLSGLRGPAASNNDERVAANTVAPWFEDAHEWHIQLEITESLVMSDFKQVINISNDLKAAGIRLAMDDFGTGYSSLSYLHRLPFSALKIDRSFISVMKTRKSSDDDIVAAVIRLANNFNMKVVAEGVENHSQLMALDELGCDYVQGYLISKPKPASEIEAMIAEGKTFLNLTSSMDTTVVSIT